MTKKCVVVFFFLLATHALAKEENLPHLRVYPDGCRRMRAINKKQCLPGIVVNGQLKAGTTSLFAILEKHPQIDVMRTMFGTSHKEVNSFWFQEAANNTKKYYQRLRGFPLRPMNDTRVGLEASPFYLSTMVDLGEDLSMFQRVQPNIKFVTTLRNPVDRSFSEFLMLSDHWDYASVCNGTTYEDIVKEELAVADKRLLTDANLKHRCLTQSPMFYFQDKFAHPRAEYTGRLVRWSEYSRYLKKWMSVFNSSQLYVMKVEDLDTKPEETVRKLLTWLGLDANVPLQAVHHNKASCRFKSKGDCGQDDLNTASNAQTKYNVKTAHALLRHFKPFNDELAALTGLDVSDWNSGFKKSYTYE